jgi:hypothetical protein
VTEHQKADVSISALLTVQMSGRSVDKIVENFNLKVKLTVQEIQLIW